MAAKTTRDVVAAVNFAPENNLRLVVKGGGLSYAGTSAAPEFAADMDAGDERRRAARRLCREGMPGSAGAGRIALINASGNLSGILGP